MDVRFTQCEVESDGVREKKGLFKIKRGVSHVDVCKRSSPDRGHENGISFVHIVWQFQHGGSSLSKGDMVGDKAGIWAGADPRGLWICLRGMKSPNRVLSRSTTCCDRFQGDSSGS